MSSSNRYRTLVAIILILLILAVPTATLADTLPFASLEFPPYNYKKNGHVTGFTPEIVRRIVRKMGHTPTIELLPWQRAQAEAARGEYAGIFTFTKSADRMRNFRYTAPVAKIKDVFFKRKNDTITWQSLSDLSRYEIGASAYNYADVFLNAMNDGTLNVQVIHSETPEILHLRKLKHHRIDLAICELRLCQFLIEQNAPTFRGIDHIERPIGPVRTFHIGISREWPRSRRLTRRFNRHLGRMAENGTLEALMNEHLAATTVRQPLEDFVLGLVDDLAMYVATREINQSDTDASALTNRLRRTLRNHASTLGWDRGRVLVVWVRNGSFQVEGKQSGSILLASEQRPAGQEGVVRTSNQFTVGLLQTSSLRHASPTIHFQSSADSPALGGYVTFNGTRTGHFASVDPVIGKRTIRLSGGK